MSIDMNKPLKLGTEEAKDFLRSLQGNILQSHSRDEAFHLFISFGSPQDEGSMDSMAGNFRTWIGTLLARGDITSAYHRQFDDADKTGTFQTLLLSSPGYDLLGRSRPRDGSFRDGMRDRGNRLNDPSPTTWENDYRYEDNKKQVHALLIIADNDVVALDATVASVKDELSRLGAEILVAERGHQKKEAGKAVEHFGYRDGVSQPRFIEQADDPDDLPPDMKFDQRTALKRVLEKDRLADGHFGSFLVFRKLEQDVDSFNAAVANIAQKTDQTIDFVGAQAVGRFKNGTPLADSGVEDNEFETTGDGKFDYEDDDKGVNCPLHAHIRKVNPRNSLGFFTDLFAREKTRRIARRGITYGDGTGKVGLIFICYQADIKDQFEFMQRRWANSPRFSKPGTGLDPVIGQDDRSRENEDHPEWLKQYGSDKGRERVAFGEHVKLRGGEYFFAPSFEGLRILSTDAPSRSSAPAGTPLPARRSR